MSGLTSSREKLINEENNIDEENNNTNEGFDDETDVSSMKQTSTGKDQPMDDGYLNRHHTLRRTVSRPNNLPEELPPLTVDTNLSCAGYGRRDMIACKTPRILRRTKASAAAATASESDATDCSHDKHVVQLP